MVKAPKCFRLRFTLRTLAIVVTLVCCYAACWEATKRDGVRDVGNIHTHHFHARADAPMLVSVDRGWTEMLNGREYIGLPTHRCYYFWFFGFVAKLPYERELEQDASWDASLGVE